MGRNRRKNKRRQEDDGTNRAGSSSGHTWSLEVPGSSVLYEPRGSSARCSTTAHTSLTAASPVPSTSGGSSSAASSSKSSRDSDSRYFVQRDPHIWHKHSKSWQKCESSKSHKSDASSRNKCSSSSESGSAGFQPLRKKTRTGALGVWDSQQRCPEQTQEQGHKQSNYSQRRHWEKWDKHRQGQSQLKATRTSTQRHSGTGEQQTGAAGDTDTSGDSLDIPGFYYDPEKKKYFKILPSTGNVNVVTKETIARDKAEAQRQADLRLFESGKMSSTPKSSSSVSVKLLRRKPKCQTVASAVMGEYQQGEVSKYRLQKLFTLDTVSNLRPAGWAEVFPDCQGPHRKLEHMHQMEISHDHKKILCLWSVRESMVQRLQLVTLREVKRTCPGRLALEFDPSGTTVMQSWNKITNVCWADFPQSPGKKYVLYTTMCHTGQAYSLAFIRNLDPEVRDDVNFSDFNLGTKATWTCAWNAPKQQFSVGSEKGCLVIDITTRRLWQFKTNNSDALAQTFSREGGSLYTGTRRGQILLHDLRSSSTYPTTLMSHKSSIACLRLSSDETRLYASDFSGKISCWDLRKRRLVVNYEGLYNQYTKLPFYIDETESILYGAGQDCYSKIWRLDTGKLLLSIPPPCQASRDTIPALQFSTRWADCQGNAGIIMGAMDKFYLYTTDLEEGGEESDSPRFVTDRWHHDWISVITV